MNYNMAIGALEFNLSTKDNYSIVLFYVIEP